MQIELSPDTQTLLQKQLARDGFPSVEAAIEEAIRFYESHRPTMESLKAKLQEGLDDAAEGRVAPLDIEEIKRRGRERLAARQTARTDD